MSHTETSPKGVVEAGSLDVSETLQLKPSEDVPSKPAEPLPSEDLGIAQSEASSEFEIFSDLLRLFFSLGRL